MVLQFIFATLYCLIFLAAVIGNSLFLVAVKRNSKLHTAVFILLANEALSDLLFILLSTFQAAQNLLHQWIFGDLFCRIQATLLEMSYTISCLSLSAVAVERHKSICFAIQYTRRTKRWTLKACFIIWILSFLLTSPLLHFNRLDRVNPSKNWTQNITYNKCGSGGLLKTDGVTIYFGIQYFLIYLIPLILLIYTNSRIILTLRESSKSKFQMVSESTHQSQQIAFKEHIRNKKMNKMLTVTTIVFFILWTPHVAIRLIRSIILTSEILLKFAVTCLLVSTVTNFFITLFMSKEFRDTVRDMFKMRRSRTSSDLQPDITLSSSPSSSTRPRSSTCETLEEEG